MTIAMFSDNLLWVGGNGQSEIDSGKSKVAKPSLKEMSIKYIPIDMHIKKPVR